MNQDVDNSTLLTRYLLGDLSEGEEVSVERRFFEDSGFLDELHSTERDLVNYYVRGELTGNSLKRFEQRFLTEPERRSRVLFASALAESIARRHGRIRAAAGGKKDDSGAWSWVRNHSRELLAAAAVLVIVLSAVLWSLIEEGGRQSAPTFVEERPDAPEPGPPPPVGPTVTEPDEVPPRASVPAIILRPGRLRGEEGNQLVIPAGVKFVRLVIELRRRDYPKYRVSLQTLDGGVVWQSGHLKVVNRRGHLSTRVAVGQLVSRDYLVVVKGLNQSGLEDDVDNYYFEAIGDSKLPRLSPTASNS